MKRRFRVLSAMFIACSLVPALAAEPVLVYERVHKQVAHDDNRVSLTVFDDDTAEAHFPVYTPQAGDYQWQLSPEERDELLGMAEGVAEVEPQQILRNIEQQRTLGHTVVSDADQVTIRISDSTRGDHSVSVPSPAIWLRSRPDDEQLAKIVETATGLAEWMRARVQEESR